MSMRAAFAFLFFCVILLGNTARAQLQIMPSVNLLTAGGNSFVGVSLSGRYFVCPRLAAGINLRYVSEIDLLITTLEVDYFFLNTKVIKPYLGLEAGLFSQYRGQLFSGAKAPGISPRVGIQCKLSSLLALQLDAGYPIAIHKGESFGSDSGLLVGAGLNFTFDKR